MISRQKILSKIRDEYLVHQVCALIGPRQCGKTTLAKAYIKEIKEPVHFFDCENPLHIARLKNPMLAMQGLNGMIVIDEIQLRPDLFPVIRVLVDEDPKLKFLITGSASRDLLRQSSETLAGRIGYNNITPFTLEEVDDFDKLWQIGGFPKSFLAVSEKASQRWRSEYIKTFLERDILKLGFEVSPDIAGRLWRSLSHMQGQVLNIHKLAASLMLDQRTVKRYLSILEGSFMLTLLRPWHSNGNKREVKSPKIYIRDSGILHSLLGLDQDQIMFNPNLGASFEGFAIEQIMCHFDSYETSYFWSTHSGAELDLLNVNGGKKMGFEIKYTDSPRITKSMHIAIEDLGLDHLCLVIPGKEIFRMDEKITCIGISALGGIS